MKLLITVIIYALFIAYLLGAVLYFIGNKSGKKRALSTASLMVKIGLVLNIAALIVRTMIAGRLPLANSGEFTLWFTVVTVALYLYYEAKAKMREAGGAVMLISALLVGSIIVLMVASLGSNSTDAGSEKSLVDHSCSDSSSCLRLFCPSSRSSYNAAC